MLTDYHWHLREDEDDSPPDGFAFTAENVDRYVTAAEEAGVAELGCSEHVYQFRQALGLWRHPFWEQQARDDLDAYCEFVRTTPLRLGIEVDFVPGTEDRTRNRDPPDLWCGESRLTWRSCSAPSWRRARSRPRSAPPTSAPPWHSVRSASPPPSFGCCCDASAHY